MNQNWCTLNSPSRHVLRRESAWNLIRITGCHVCKISQFSFILFKWLPI